MQLPVKLKKETDHHPQLVVLAVSSSSIFFYALNCGRRIFLDGLCAYFAYLNLCVWICEAASDSTQS